MSRSEFFSRAAARYLDELDNKSLAHQIELAITTIGGDGSVVDAIKVGRRLLANAPDEW